MSYAEATETTNSATFAEYLRTLRTAAKLTQDAVADECRVRQPAVSAWERGAAYPSPSALLTMARLYDADKGELLERMVADQDGSKVPAQA